MDMLQTSSWSDSRSSFPQNNCGVDIEVLLERLRNTEARLFKAQSDLFQEREEQRLAKALTRIDFDNHLISEKSLRRQQKVTFEQEIRNTKSESACLRTALAASKNILLMNNMIQLQSPSSDSGTDVTKKHSATIAGRFFNSEDSFLCHGELINSHESSWPGPDCASDHEAMLHIAQLRNEVAIARESAWFAEEEAKRLRTELSETQGRQQDKSSLIENLKQGLPLAQRRFPHADMISHRIIASPEMEASAVAANAAANSKQGHQDLGIAPDGMRCISSSNDSEKLSYEVEIYLLGLAVTDLGKLSYNAQASSSSVQHKLASKLLSVEHDLAQVHSRVVRLKRHGRGEVVTKQDTAEALRRDRALKEMTELNEVLRGEIKSLEIARAADIESLNDLNSEFCLYKDVVTKKLSYLSYLYEEGEKNLTSQIEKERHEKQLIISLYKEAKLRIKDLELELIDALGKLCSCTVNHKEYQSTEPLRLQPNFITQENARLKAGANGLEHTLAMSTIEYANVTSSEEAEKTDESNVFERIRSCSHGGGMPTILSKDIQNQGSSYDVLSGQAEQMISIINLKAIEFDAIRRVVMNFNYHENCCESRKNQSLSRYVGDILTQNQRLKAAVLEKDRELNTIRKIIMVSQRYGNPSVWPLQLMVEMLVEKNQELMVLVKDWEKEQQAFRQIMKELDDYRANLNCGNEVYLDNDRTCLMPELSITSSRVQPRVCKPSSLPHNSDGTPTATEEIFLLPSHTTEIYHSSQGHPNYMNRADFSLIDDAEILTSFGSAESVWKHSDLECQSDWPILSPGADFPEPFPSADPSNLAGAVLLAQQLENYSGQHELGRADGRGIKVWSDGRIYDGQLQQDEFSGLGTCVWSGNGDMYEGEWLGGQAHGLGSYHFASGDFYEGGFEHNKFHGFGAFQKQSGLRTLGQWISGKLLGWGLVIFPNGKRFIARSESGINFSARQSKMLSDDELSNILIKVDETVKGARKKINVIRQEQLSEIHSAE